MSETSQLWWNVVINYISVCFFIDTYSLLCFSERDFKVDTFTVVADFSSNDKRIYEYISEQILDKEIGILSNIFILI